MTIPNTRSAAWVIPGLFRGSNDNHPHTNYSVDEIMFMVCYHFNVSNDDLLKKSKSTEVIYHRHIAIYLTCMYASCTISLTGIAKAFGMKDHTSIIHAREKIRGLLTLDHEVQLKDDIKAIMDILPLTALKFSA